MPSAESRMHTAEHLLNQTMVRRFGCERCFSMHLHRKKSKCDYHFPRPLTDPEVAEVQAAVNAVIDQDLPVRTENMDRTVATRHFNLERLPASAGDTLRIIRIGDYDACPCIGDHVSSTAQIGHFTITTTTFSDGVLRIRFKLKPR